MFNFIKNLIILIAVALFCVSCTTSRVIENTMVPDVEIDSNGEIWVRDRSVKVGKVGRKLRSAGFRREQTVNILIPDQPDTALMKAVASDLAVHGFSRTAFIKNKSATSTSAQDKR